MLTAVDDSDAAENLEFTLSSAGDSAAITINPVKPVVEFTAPLVRVPEGDGFVSVALRLSAIPATNVIIPVVTSDGSALTGSDYTMNASFVRFPAGASGAALTRTVPVIILDDTQAEPDKYFIISLGTPLPIGVSAGAVNNVKVTIVNDDLPSVNFASPSVTVAESSGRVELSVQLSATPVTTLRIPITTSGTATAGNDYAIVQPAPKPGANPNANKRPPPTTTLIFAAGTSGSALTQTVIVDILNDSARENDETLTLTLGTLPEGVSTGSPRDVTVTITDDDMLALSVAAARGSIIEGGATEITVTASVMLGADLSVPYTITGVADTDYRLTDENGAPASSPIIVTNGRNSATLTLTALDDADTSAETLTFALSAPGSNAGYTLDSSATRSSSATVVIVPVQPATPKAPVPALSVSLSAIAPVTDPAVIFEAESTRIVITANTAPTTDLDVPVSITGVADGDYRLFQGADQILPGSGKVRLLATATSATLRLLAVDDADVAFEDLQFNLDAPADLYTLGTTASATIRIHPIATFSITSSIALEVAESAGRVEVTVELTANPSVDVTIPVRTVNVSTTNLDYQLMTQELRFPADGETRTGTITIDLVADDSPGEPTELFRVVLGEPTPATRGLVKGNHGNADIYITDNGASTVSFDTLSAAQTRVAELDGDWPITLRLNAPQNGFVQVPVTLGGTATRGSDYQIVRTDTVLIEGGVAFVNFAAGVTTGQLIIRVLADTTDEEPEETITLGFGTLPSRVVADTANNAREITIVPVPPVTLSLFVNPTTITAPSVDSPTRETRTLARRPTVPSAGGLVTVDIRADRAPTVDVNVLFSVAGRPRSAYDLKADNGRLEILQSVGMTTAYSVVLPAGRTSTSLNLTLDADQRKVAGRIGIALQQPPKRNIYNLSDNEALQAQTILIVGANDKGTRTLPPIPVEFATDAITVNEADGFYDIPVRFSGGAPNPNPDPISVPIMTTDGTATAGSDYTAIIAGQVRFAPGARSATVRGPVTDDNLVEANETFTITFGNLAGTGVVAGTRTTLTVTIVSDDTATLTFDEATRTHSEGAIGDRTEFNVGVSLSNPVGQETTISLEVVAGATATEGTDFEVADSVTFAAGSSAATFRVTYLGNNVVEANKGFDLTFGTPLPAGITLGTQDTATFVISNDDTATVAFTTDTVSEMEGTGPHRVEVILSREIAVDTIVQLTIVGGATATNNADYSGVPNGVSFMANSRLATFEVTFTEDNLVEGDEEFQLTFNATLPAGISSLAVPHTVTFTIVDNDISVSFSEGMLTVAEDIGTVPVTVELSSPAPSDIAVPLSWADASARVNTDYTRPGSSVIVVAGEMTATLNIPIINDNVVEPDERFAVALSLVTVNLTFTTGGFAAVAITIENDDTTTVSFADVRGAPITSVTIVEGNTGLGVLSLTNPVATNIRLPIVYTDGTAEGGTHYDNTFLTTSIAAGQRFGSIAIGVFDDTVANDDRTFTISFDTSALDDVELSTPGGTLTVIIENDDDPIPVEFADATATVAEGGGPVMVTVRLSEAATQEIIVPVMTVATTESQSVSTGNTEAFASEDYTALPSSVTFATGDTEQTIAITITDDDRYENDETFVVTFGTLPSSVTAGTQTTTTVTITDDETLTITYPYDTVTITEGSTMTVVFALNRALAVPLEFPWLVSSPSRVFTAELGVDYTIGDVTAARSSRTATMTITIIDDDIEEDAEEFTFDLDELNATGLFPARTTAEVVSGNRERILVTIPANDAP